MKFRCSNDSGRTNISVCYRPEPDRLVGVINHTESRWWSFDRPGLTKEPAIRNFKRARSLGIVFAVIETLLLLDFAVSPAAVVQAHLIEVALLFALVFFATLKVSAKTFEGKVNKALQEEIARRCATGCGAPVREAAPGLSLQQVLSRASAHQVAAGA